ncbi:MAG: hypothetical protein EF806_05065 [Candidatus Methanoliparum thermophilum]|uniref:DUF5320 domain-containing protein n=1 Tax=Methanoliparum thermophilum TaxID=2491083 RepID=A0A520KRD3_METT2|nr:DUF5320 domain-containing protein [Candidatus Methanoliparum sp. LAM-1]RZN64185.1 MAG: hypothetical protein EF806_05065 [Candidatus Methanoliparum thermophilum]BDC36635.1 hypothetical protein MTLP_13170 [Candidatus Methanoliparum sp. LAM-1]
MPWGDRTGPMGLGPRTGRGLGLCSGYPVPGYLGYPRRAPFFRGRYPVPGYLGYPRRAPFFRGRGFWYRGFGWW